MTKLVDFLRNPLKYPPRMTTEVFDEVADRLEEAAALLHESVDRYPVEENPDLWTSRVRAWLKKNA